MAQHRHPTMGAINQPSAHSRAPPALRPRLHKRTHRTDLISRSLCGAARPARGAAPCGAPPASSGAGLCVCVAWSTRPIPPCLAAAGAHARVLNNTNLAIVSSGCRRVHFGPWPVSSATGQHRASPTVKRRLGRRAVVAFAAPYQSRSGSVLPSLFSGARLLAKTAYVRTPRQRKAWPSPTPAASRGAAAHAPAAPRWPRRASHGCQLGALSTLPRAPWPRARGRVPGCSRHGALRRPAAAAGPPAWWSVPLGSTSRPRTTASRPR